MLDLRSEFAVDIIRQAGQITLKYFRSNHTTEFKHDNSPVTIADRETERFIREKIAKEYPSDGILGEEEECVGDQNHRWVIDPIDGTKSFASGVPLYAVLLSYEINKIPTIACCYIPAVDELYFAAENQGAFCNGNPIKVNNATTWEHGVVCCAGHKSMHKAGFDVGLNSIAGELMATRTWCDAYGHMMVARGDAIAMIDPVVQHYDVSSPWLIVREAGGRFTTSDGSSELPGLSGLSSNGLMHESALKMMQTGSK